MQQILLILLLTETCLTAFAQRQNPLLFPFRKGTLRCGYIDIRGNVILRPKFGGCSEFSEGVAVITEPSVWWGLQEWFDAGLSLTTKAFIDDTGRYLLKFEPSGIYPQGPFAEGLAPACKLKEKKCGFIDHSGRVVILLRFDHVETFHEGLAVVSIDHERSYLRKDGTLLGSSFDHAHDFSEGYGAVSVSGKWGFIDSSGKYAISPQFKAVGHFSEGLAPASDGSKWGFIDKGGKFVIPPQFEYAGQFSEGLAKVATESVFLPGRTYPTSVFGFIDKSGKMAIAPHFIDARDFSEGLAAVAIAQQAALPSTGGQTKVVTGEKYGFINAAGQFVIPPQFFPADSFKNGLAQVNGWDDMKYVDKSGKVVWSAH